MLGRSCPLSLSFPGLARRRYFWAGDGALAGHFCHSISDFRRDWAANFRNFTASAIANYRRHFGRNPCCFLPESPPQSNCRRLFSPRSTMASVPFTDPGCHGCFSDRHPWIYFSVLLVLAGISNRAQIATTTCRRTIMNRRNEHQIAHHPKTTFAGQLVYPHC